MSISEQVKELRKAAKWFDTACFTEGAKLANEAADTIESLSVKLQSENCGGGWINCNLETLPDKEVLCCDQCGEMILGYIFEDETSETGFSAENDHEYMYNCVKWMEKPKP